jgi:hypothetical protein
LIHFRVATIKKDLNPLQISHVFDRYISFASYHGAIPTQDVLLTALRRMLKPLAAIRIAGFEPTTQ